MIAEVNAAAGYKTLDALRHAIEKRLSSGPVKVPMMPEVAARVMSITSDPDTDVSDMSDLIHRDPSLAARVLKVANSATYASSEPITSLQDAVNRLGIKTLGEVVLSVSLHAGIFRVPGFEPEVNRLWRHALASGYFGREIARLNRGRSDSLFLCGLLHAVGKPALLQVLADLRKQHDFLMKPETVRILLDEYHWTITARMAEQWELPRPVQITCAHYRNYADAPDCRSEAATTYLADRMASWLISPGEVDEETLKQDAVFASLRIDSDGVQRVMEMKETVQSQVDALNR